MKEMEKKLRGELIVGLDVGTTKICAVIGEALSLIHISEPTRPPVASRMPSSA